MEVPLSVGPDGLIYVSIGDIRGGCGIFINESCPIADTAAENNAGGLPTDGRAGILRVTLDGGIAHGYGLLGSTKPLNLYYAYGIRNSFGMDFDPLTGKLWDTENGANWGDEINLVEPGFNSGWKKVQAKWTVPERRKERTIGISRTT